MTTHTPNPAIENYIRAREKSLVGAFLLALLLGPLGALYGAPLGGAILLLATIALAASELGVVAGLFGWLLAILIAPLAASDHNARVRAEAELMAGGAQ